MNHDFLLEERLRRLVETPLRVHLTGETGTGKNHWARLFREAAERRGEPFVELNAANLSDELFEGELFGARRGAYTGAIHDRSGVLERTGKGILFLNEVGELSPNGQAKLLVVLDSGLYRRLGETTDRHFAGRILSATNRDLEEEVRAGRFRADLYYRLAQVVIVIPPLRDRPGEILPLVRQFVRTVAQKRGRPVRLERGALRLLRRHAWPGNVRELRDTVEALAWLSSDGWIRTEVMAARLLASAMKNPAPPATRPLRQAVDALEREELVRALLATGGNKTRAARRLGLSVVGLRLKLRRLGLEG